MNINMPIMQIIQFAKTTMFDDDEDSENEILEKVTVYNMNDKQFQRHFRMCATTFENLFLRVHGFANIPGVGYPRTSFEKELLVTIWCLSNLECFRSLADRFGLSKSTCWEVLYRTCKLLLVVNDRLKIIQWPSRQRQTEISNAFNSHNRGIEGIVGCIDGCHIPIVAPKANPNSYINRKGFHSILLQGVCDHKLLFTHVYAGEAGSIHDYTLYKRSDLYQGIWSQEILFYGDTHIIGDLAYKLDLNLLVGFKNNGHLSRRQKNFNYTLNKSRVKIERAFAFLKGRFRRLKSLETIRLDLVAMLIVTGCILHNICIMNEDFLEGQIDIEQERLEYIAHNPWNLPDMDAENEQSEAIQKRLNIVNALPIIIK